MQDCHLYFGGAKIDGGYLNFSNAHIGARASDGISPRSGFVHEWLDGLRKMESVSSRDMVHKKCPYGVVDFLDAELCRGHIDFDFVDTEGALLEFPAIRASGGEITFADSIFASAAISFWNAQLSSKCVIKIQPISHEAVTILYSRAYRGLNGRVVPGERVELLEVSGSD
ncbi:MAG: hypothetical protein LC749_13440 [Actinobacteria bacterium]|nr:hypothetical protein [Actinomycetota bacterium]